MHNRNESSFFRSKKMLLGHQVLSNLLTCFSSKRSISVAATGLDMVPAYMLHSEQGRYQYALV